MSLLLLLSAPPRARLAHLDVEALISGTPDARLAHVAVEALVPAYQAVTGTPAPSVVPVAAPTAVGALAVADPAAPAVVPVAAAGPAGLIGVTGTPAGPAVVPVGAPGPVGALGLAGAAAPAVVPVTGPPAVDIPSLVGTPTPAVTPAAAPGPFGAFGLTGVTGPAVTPVTTPGAGSAAGIVGVPVPAVVTVLCTPVTGLIGVTGTPAPAVVPVGAPDAFTPVPLTGTPGSPALILVAAPAVTGTALGIAADPDLLLGALTETLLLGDLLITQGSAVNGPLPAQTSEYLESEIDSIVGDPMLMDWLVAVSATATRARHAALLTEGDFTATTAVDRGDTVTPRYTVRVPVDGLTPGRYGVWLQVDGIQYASPWRFSGAVTFV